MRALLVALGDLGRSPRIQLHARALAGAGATVDLVGFAGTRCWLLDGCASVRLHPIDGGPALNGSGFGTAWRGAALASRLTRALLNLPRPDVVLVQTPPAIPTVAVAALIARARGAGLVVDWHNLGYTLLALRMGERHPLVRVAERLEGLARAAGARHLCVSAALQQHLARRYGIAATVFADRPASAFRPGDDRELRRSFTFGLGVPGDPLLVVSPTSWTVDEDLALLDRAAGLLEGQLRERDVLFVATGQGPGRERFDTEWRKRKAGRVHLRTAWLEGPDYPRLLAAADLGLSLHRSSSGLDLPMKIADMLGAGLPVCALEYPALGEQLVAGRDGWLFRDEGELASLVARMACDGRLLEEARRAVAQAPRETWEEGWAREARDVILG